MDSKEYIRAWDRRVGQTTAHLQYDDKYLKKKNLQAFYEKAIGKVPIEKKSIIDIGCGGGLLGEWLLEKYDCDYTGIDISERSVMTAQKRLPGLNASVYLMSDPVNGLELLQNNFDIGICLNVIQHIPDQEYFEIFFNALNESGIKILILQYKHNSVTLFQETPYKTTHEINLACYTNKKTVKGLLSNYVEAGFKKSGENDFIIMELNC